ADGQSRNAGSAAGAEVAGFQVDPLNRMRRGHDALIVFAVLNGMRVPQFVDRFLQKTTVQEFFIGRQAVEFLAKAMVGDDGTNTSELSFAKHKSEDRNIEIGGSYRE